MKNTSIEDIKLRALELEVVNWRTSLNLPMVVKLAAKIRELEAELKIKDLIISNLKNEKI